ncbi:MAG TPA: BadF/BadG/BcrA/BcrD ATPase family protein [Capillimicrobium sp.]
MIVGIDAGQTGVRAAAEGGAPGPELPGVRRMEGGVGPRDVADMLLQAFDALPGSHAEVDVVAVGLSGFELATEQDLREIARRLRFGTGAGRVALGSDGVTSLLGAVGREAGIVVAVGTGVVTLGHDGAGAWARVDGWGSLLGDDGSGFAIGAAGLRAALRALDGREGGSSTLLDAAVAAYGAPERIPLAVHRGGGTARAVAAFTPAVARAAGDGDEVAEAIWARAGDDLAASAAAAARRLFAPTTAVTVARAGNVWRAGDLLGRPFARGLAQRWPEAQVVDAQGSSLDGALSLGRAGGALAAVPGLLWWDGG